MSAAPDFSNPELNPLINPLLGRNLARWAQVYLTTAPEQREAAITNLLHELEAEAQTDASGALNSGSMFSTPSPPPVCPKCGHQSLSDARFCGSCGASLMDAEAFLVDSSRHEGGNSVGDRAPAPTAFSSGAFGQPFAAAAQPAPSPVPAPELPSFAPASEPPPSSNLDVTWLRERNLFGAADDEPRSYAKYLLVLLVVLGAAGAFLYFRGSTAVSKLAPPIASAPAPPTPAPGSAVSSAGTPGPSAPDSGTPSIPQTAASAASAVNATPAPPAAVTASPAAAAQPHRANNPSMHSTALATAASATATSTADVGTSSQDNGSAELAVAEDYLEGRKGTRNSTAAAVLLWRAVAKQNETAILLLSDLYVSGDGVPQSCEQARILLSAAARRNVKAAADRLHSLAGSCR